MNPKAITKIPTKELVYELLARVERAEQIVANLRAAVSDTPQQRKASAIARATIEPASRKVLDALHAAAKAKSGKNTGRMQPGALRQPILSVTRAVALKVAEIQKALKADGYLVSGHQIHAQLRALAEDGKIKRTGKVKSYRYKAA